MENQLLVRGEEILTKIVSLNSTTQFIAEVIEPTLNNTLYAETALELSGLLLISLIIIACLEALVTSILSFFPKQAMSICDTIEIVVVSSSEAVSLMCDFYVSSFGYNIDKKSQKVPTALQAVTLAKEKHVMLIVERDTFIKNYPQLESYVARGSKKEPLSHRIRYQRLQSLNAAVKCVPSDRVVVPLQKNPLTGVEEFWYCDPCGQICGFENF